MKISEYVNSNSYNRINHDTNTTKYDKNSITTQKLEIVQGDENDTSAKGAEEKQELNSDNHSTTQLLDSQQAIELAINFDMKSDQSLIGSASNLTDLDITKEISALKKDRVLQEYSYFINDINPEDGFVIRKTK